MSFVSIKGLSKIYTHSSGSITVLNHIDLEIFAGKSIAMIGPSGSGKSTLLSLIAGLDTPSSGSIHIGGSDIAKMSEQALTKFRANTLGIVFQQFHLMSHLNAIENVALPLFLQAHPDAWSLAKLALEKVQLGHRLKHYPKELSGGECQRVAIARALIKNPPLILADEPSGNLDSQTGSEVMKLLFSLVKENHATLILVTDNEDLARSCDERLTLSRGQLTHV